jgi:ParB family chromosome partitioning protein
MKKPRGLGRGLDALIPPNEKTEAVAFRCPVDEISPHPGQPRQVFDPQRLEELVQTIREKGVLSPVIVRSFGDGYQLISGERRWRAAKMAGLPTIPAILREASDRDALELSLIENIQREDLSPLEEARAYQALLDLYQSTQEELALRLGKDRSTIANALRLLRLPEPARQALERGQITPGHARCILSVPAPLQKRLLQDILARELSVRAAERWAQGLASARRSKPVRKSEPSVHLERVRDSLRSLLSTQVNIQEGKRKGKIVIEYYNRGDLDRILKLLLSRTP